MSRSAYLGLAATVVLAGLLLRLVNWGLPLSVHHYGGGILWGAMLFLLVSALRPPGRDFGTSLIVSGVMAAAIEVARLFHTPGLDAFRTTLAGQLLLGRIFSGWNLIAYAAGIGATAALTRSATSSHHRRTAAGVDDRLTETGRKPTHP